MDKLLSENIQYLEAELLSLGQQLRQVSYLVAIAADLPEVPAEQENDIVQEIQLSPVLGEAAVAAANRCYQDLLIRTGLSKKIARRTLGVIQVGHSDPLADSLRKSILTINQLKSAIESHVTTHYHSRADRFAAMHAALPGVMTLHLYRQIKLLDGEEVSALRFTWQQKDNIRRVDRDQLLDRIATDMETRHPDAQVPLQQLWNQVAAVAEDKLRIRRPVRVQPAANATVNGKLMTLNAPTPVIIIQDALAEVKMPGDFDGTRPRKIRSDRRGNLILGAFAGEQIEALID